MADATLATGKETDEDLAAMRFDHHEMAKHTGCAHAIARKGGAVRGKRAGQHQPPS
jgi:hypothetical protein